jgi:hypothetical protein
VLLAAVRTDELAAAPDIDARIIKYIKDVGATNGCDHLATAVAAAGVGSETS